MKTNIQQLINSVEGIRELSTARVPGKVALSLIRIARKVDAALADFNDTRKKMLQDTGLTPDEQGNYKFETPESAQAFSIDMGAVLMSEVEIDNNPIPFSKIADVTMSPTTLGALEWMIDTEA